MIIRPYLCINFLTKKKLIKTYNTPIIFIKNHAQLNQVEQYTLIFEQNATLINIAVNVYGWMQLQFVDPIIQFLIC